MQKLWALPLKNLKAKAIEIFNKYIRTRDEYQRCITCSGRVEHACHYFSADKYWWLRFNVVNVNGGCRNCNFYKHPTENVNPNDRAMHREAIIERHGREAYDELIELSLHEPTEYPDKDFYIDIIERFRC